MKATTNVEKITDTQKDMLLDVCARMTLVSGFDHKMIEHMNQVINTTNEAIVHQQLAEKLSK